MVNKGYEGIKSGQPWSRAVKMWSAHGQKRGRLELKCLNLDKPDQACSMRKILNSRKFQFYRNQPKFDIFLDYSRSKLMWTAKDLELESRFGGSIDTGRDKSDSQFIGLSDRFIGQFIPAFNFTNHHAFYSKIPKFKKSILKYLAFRFF